MTPRSNEKKPKSQPAVQFDRNVLEIDPAAVAKQIEEAIPRIVGRRLRRRGTVVAVSGGVDSAVCATLCVRALGANRVFGLLMPMRTEGNAMPDWLALPDRNKPASKQKPVSHWLDADAIQVLDTRAQVAAASTTLQLSDGGK